MITPAQLARKISRREGFTLVEVIIASSIFTVVSLIGVTIFINVIRIQKRIYLENAIYEDGRFMMERLSREIRGNAIDYEEYYNKLVEESVDYGAKHGCYATRFYNPGTDGPYNGGLGAYCSNPPLVDPKTKPGCVIDKTTLDINTGRNPYEGITAPDNTAGDANAMCSLKFPLSPACTMDPTLNDRDELYLIDSKGKEKTIFALKQFNSVPEYALGMVRIDGKDSNGDDIVDQWIDKSTVTPSFFCALGFDCPASGEALLSLESTLGFTPATLYQGFIPMTPQRTNITRLRFYVSPLEDPRKAFAETDAAQAIQQQPHVTIVMTLQPAASELSAFQGSAPTITLQTTVSSRVYNEVKSYGAGFCDDY